MDQSQERYLSGLERQEKFLPNASGNLILRQVVCETIIFRNEQTGYTVAVFSQIEMEGVEFTATGSLPPLDLGDVFELEGSWIEHANYGRQFRIISAVPVIPQSPTAMIAYLSSGLFSGIGTKMAQRIVDRFGDDSLSVLRDEPGQVAVAIKGISLSKAKKISEQVAAKTDVHELSLLLAPLGLGSQRVGAIYKRFGTEALEIIRSNPYRLVDEIKGIGFKTADQLAKSLGIGELSLERVSSAILHLLNVAENEGHTYCLKADFLNRLGELLQVNLPKEYPQIDSSGDTLKYSQGFLAVWQQALESLSLSNKILLYDFDSDGNFSANKLDTEMARISLIRTFEAEAISAKVLANKLESETDVFDEGKLLEEVLTSAQSLGLVLAQEQVKAVSQALAYNVSIITGGPGTGKTTIIKVLIDLLQKRKRKIVLAAPTGRAAKRMTESTDFPASTLHRLLEFERGEDHGFSLYFRKNQDNPIAADVIIVDELSMLDIYLFKHFLLAVPQGCRLIFVGDRNQLPSVGAGNVLSDLISSEFLPVTELTKIFRQAEKSRIIVNAHRILQGESIIFDQSLSSDCLLVNKETPETISAAVVKLFSNVLPKIYGLDPLKDVTVLAPARKGIAGIANLNLLLQESILQDSKESIKIRNFSFHLGDKVIQNRNNYDLSYTASDQSSGVGVFNGEVGYVKAIDTKNNTLWIETEDMRLIEYSGANLEDLEPAFALTVHKSQGSEYPVVVLAISPGSSLLNNRNLLYTALTRAKQRIFIVSSKRILRQMIDNSDQKKRRTALATFLKLYEA